jgi:hypothetical protein
LTPTGGVCRDLPSHHQHQLALQGRTLTPHRVRGPALFCDLCRAQKPDQVPGTRYQGPGSRSTATRSQVPGASRVCPRRYQVPGTYGQPTVRLRSRSRVQVPAARLRSRLRLATATGPRAATHGRELPTAGHGQGYGYGPGSMSRGRRGRAQRRGRGVELVRQACYT